MRGQAAWIGRLGAGLGGAALATLAAMRGLLFPWVPVFLGFGIALWFALPSEPGLAVYLWAGSAGAIAFLIARVTPEHARPFLMALACVAIGFLATGLRAATVAAPKLEFRYYGAVTGRVVEIDRSQSDALRLTLDRVLLDRVAPVETPGRVRVSIHGTRLWHQPQPGEVVTMTAHLSAPEGAVEPGGFDFARLAYFQGLGAVGYTRSPVLLAAPAAPNEAWVNRTRRHLAQAIMAAIPGDPGAYAAGAMTGDRSGLSRQATEDLRDSSLAHLLAISGMNMAFLTGFVFALIRHGTALVPWLALRINSKKLAAVAALGVAGFYLLLSGANVATERAFIMVAVMLGAVLLDRRALSLRSVSIAAVLLLLWKPEALLEPGFQMSFAATVALIAGFGALEGAWLRRRMPRWMLPVFTLIASSFIAGLATAPYAAAHFNRFADLGFFANLLTVPVMGAVVMPAGAVAALLAPLGLAQPALWVMGQGSAWILWVAHRVAAIDGAVTAIPTPPHWALALITLGGIWAVAWRGWARGLGAVPILVGLALWSHPARPMLLIAPDASLVGLMGPDGRALSVAKGAGFTAQSWLENDGDLATQAEAAARPGFTGPLQARSFTLAGWQGIVLKGKSAAEALPDACKAKDLVILAARIEALPEGCRIIDQSLLARTGGLAITPAEDGTLRVTPSRSGRRQWHPQGRAALIDPKLEKAGPTAPPSS